MDSINTAISGKSGHTRNVSAKNILLRYLYVFLMLPSKCLHESDCFLRSK